MSCFTGFLGRVGEFVDDVFDRAVEIATDNRMFGFPETEQEDNLRIMFRVGLRRCDSETRERLIRFLAKKYDVRV